MARRKTSGKFTGLCRLAVNVSGKLLSFCFVIAAIINNVIAAIINNVIAAIINNVIAAIINNERSYLAIFSSGGRKQI